MARKGDNSNVWAVIEIMEPRSCLRGCRFSITGHLGLAREEVVKIIEACGGQFEEQPRRGVTYLVTNRDWSAKTVGNGRSLKLVKAEELGIRVISEDELVQMIVDGDARVRAQEEA